MEVEPVKRRLKSSTLEYSLPSSRKLPFSSTTGSRYSNTQSSFKLSFGLSDNHPKSFCGDDKVKLCEIPFVYDDVSAHVESVSATKPIFCVPVNRLVVDQ